MFTCGAVFDQNVVLGQHISDKTLYCSSRDIYNVLGTRSCSLSCYPVTDRSVEMLLGGHFVNQTKSDRVWLRKKLRSRFKINDFAYLT